MSDYDPSERIHVLLALNRALTGLEQLGSGDTRATYEHAATRAHEYLRAYEIYLHHDEQVINHRIEIEYE